MTDRDGWHRLHPLSPVVRAGALLVAFVVFVVPSLVGERDVVRAAVELGVVFLVVLGGVVSWLVTRWRIEGDDLRIETGLLRRQSLRFPLAQIQAIDVVRPGVARVLGLAELRLRTGGATGKSGRLAYLPEHRAEALRARLLALARGEEEETPAVHERVLLTVPTPRLVASILLSRIGITVEVLAAALVATAAVSPGAAAAVVGASFASIVPVLTVFWHRFNHEYRLTVAEAPDGLRVRGGLVATVSETIPPGRVQAVRMIEPLFWRPLGWCRLEVDVAGRQRAEGEGRGTAKQLRAVLPVGSRALGLALLERILRDTAVELDPPPARARLKSPLRYHFLAWGRSERVAVTTTGRVTRVTAWVPLEKVQSLRWVQGPAQRRLGLATIHLDTAGRNVHASLRDRDAAEAEAVLRELVDDCRAARRAA